MKFFKRFLFLAALTVSPIASLHAQDGISQKKQEKILAKKAKADKKAEIKRDKEGRKRHLKIQSKDVRKRVKRNTKRADRGGTNRHKDGFFVRLFGRK